VKVVLEALKGLKTQQQLAAEFGIHPVRDYNKMTKDMEQFPMWVAAARGGMGERTERGFVLDSPVSSNRSSRIRSWSSQYALIFHREGHPLVCLFLCTDADIFEELGAFCEGKLCFCWRRVLVLLRFTSLVFPHPAKYLLNRIL